jgi:hypothetical protein
VVLIHNPVQVNMIVQTMREFEDTTGTYGEGTLFTSYKEFPAIMEASQTHDTVASNLVPYERGP